MPIFSIHEINAKLEEKMAKSKKKDLVISIKKDCIAPN